MYSIHVASRLLITAGDQVISSSVQNKLEKKKFGVSHMRLGVGRESGGCTGCAHDGRAGWDGTTGPAKAHGRHDTPFRGGGGRRRIDCSSLAHVPGVAASVRRRSTLEPVHPELEDRAALYHQGSGSAEQHLLRFYKIPLSEPANTRRHSSTFCVFEQVFFWNAKYTI